MRVTFKNDFHNTEASLNVQHPGILSKTQIRFAKLLLCGSVDCDCGGGILGERGPQHFGVVSHEQDEARIVEFDEPPQAGQISRPPARTRGDITSRGHPYSAGSPSTRSSRLGAE